MEAIRRIEKRYGSRAMTAAILGGAVLIVAGERALGKGLVLGTIFSVINFVLMGLTLPGRVDPSRRRASIRALGSIGFRYLILAVPLIAAIRLDWLDVYAVIAGLFMVQLMILGDYILGRGSVNDIE